MFRETDTKEAKLVLIRIRQKSRSVLQIRGAKRAKLIYGVYQLLFESLILAQDERWRRA